MNQQFTPLARRNLGTNTLPVVTAILRRTAVPMTVRQIVDEGGDELPTRSKTPCTVVARDLAMDIKRKGDASAFVRTSPGRFTLREMLATHGSAGAQSNRIEVPALVPCDAYDERRQIA